MTDDIIDVLIAGGGPAGLQAAVTLGRARKRVPGRGPKAPEIEGRHG